MPIASTLARNEAPLLDSPSLRFILEISIAKTIIGGALLLFLPRYGFSLEATRTLIFLYMAIGQLVFAYPSRRTTISPELNLTLHLAVVFSIGLQLLTVFIPALRQLLGLVALDPRRGADGQRQGLGDFWCL